MARGPGPRNTKGLEATKFKPGQSGNPGGRPKFAKISEAIRHILDLEDIETFVPKSVAERLALVRVKQALLKGGLFEFQAVSDRAEGKPLATVKNQFDLTGSGISIDLLNPPAEPEVIEEKEINPE